ncbi:MAG: cysteine peptidase family C39 domain-containing protein [Vicinamibacterales bacterium]
MNALEARVKELEGYAISGSAGTKVEAAREGLWILLNAHEKAIFSGPTALNSLMDQVGTPNPTSRDLLKAYEPAHRGTTLEALGDLARRTGLRVAARHVERAAEIPVPSVVHLRSDHYTTLIERRDGSYVFRDPALGGMMVMGEAALDDEMSGFVLVPVSKGEVGRPVTDEEAATVVGHCAPGLPGSDEPCLENCSPDGPSPGPGSGPNTGPGPAPPPPPPPPPGGGNTTNSPNTGSGPADTGGGEATARTALADWTVGPICTGMPTYQIHLLSASTKLSDRPCTYVPPLGPPVSLQLRYASRSTRLPQVPAYGHVGPLWSHDWMSWVEDNNTSSGAPYSWENVVVRGDTFEQYNNYSGYTHWRSRATLVKVAHDPPRYERRLPSGTVEVFTFPDRAANLPGRRVFLTQVIDPGVLTPARD